MATAAVDDYEDLFTCSVCYNIFDADSHKPKFLSCFHTLCIVCVKTIISGAKVSCPICRKETHSVNNADELANNHYILRVMASQHHPHHLRNSGRKWCLKCKKEATPSCTSSSDHSTLSTGSLSSKVCQELQQSKDGNRSQLASLIQKRNEAKKSFNKMFDALKIAENEMKKLDEETDFAYMASVLGSVGAQQVAPVPATSVPAPPIPHLFDASFNGIPFDEYLFSFTFMKGSENMGTVFMRPNCYFYRPFIQSLARFCQPPVYFEGEIIKAHQAAYATIEFSNSVFKTEVPNAGTFLQESSGYHINDALDVGLSGYTYTTETNDIVKFKLAFLVKPFDTVNASQMKVKSCPLLGNVIGGEDVLEGLSKKRLSDRSGFKVLFKFQQWADDDEDDD